MRLAEAMDPKVDTYVCGGCGYKMTKKKEGGSERKLDRETGAQPFADPDPSEPVPASKSPPAKEPSLPPPSSVPKPREVEKTHVAVVEEISITPPKREKSTPSKIKRRKAKAQKMTELRQISKELVQRVNDIEIQFDRRLEELQALSLRLTQLIESEDDT